MRKIFFTLISFVALVVVVACGGGSSSSNVVPVPAGPSGGNTNAGFNTGNLSGTYVFAANGVGNNGQSFAVVGDFVANGSGTITSGTRDTVNDAGGQTLGEAISGTYSVNGDGRGQLILSGPNGSNQTIYRFVLSSPSAGSLFQNGSTSNNTVLADAVGRIELQTGTPAASGTYVVRLNGEDTNGHYYGAIGGLNITSGTITGQIDENDSGAFNAQLATSGSITLTGSRGSASFTTPSGPNTGAHNFTVYYVSPTRLELLSTNTNFFLHGYADLQTSVAGSTSAFAGPQVFNLSGYDNASAPGLLAETGRFTLDGNGGLGSAIVDYDEMGGYFDPNFAGTYSVASTGRWIATLNNFNSGPITNQNFVGWQVSPQQSIVLVTTAANSLVANYLTLATGEMRAQTLGLTDASITGNYAQVLSGYDFSLGNFESTGNYLASGSGSLSGAIDFQADSEGFNSNTNETGNYNVDPILGRGINSTVSGVPVTLYTVGSTGTGPNAYVISTNASSVYQGTLTQQQP
jgi:hypothetical protein